MKTNETAPIGKMEKQWLSCAHFVPQGEGILLERHIVSQLNFE
jgi:hypothetical protein